MDCVSSCVECLYFTSLGHDRSQLHDNELIYFDRQSSNPLGCICCSLDWKLDRNLPPIRLRREGGSCEFSPSDPSPPSPKRMRDIYSKGRELEAAEKEKLL
eukprot:c23294_g2_i2 orf=313-615(+)